MDLSSSNAFQAAAPLELAPPSQLLVRFTMPFASVHHKDTSQVAEILLRGIFNSQVPWVTAMN